MTLEVAMLIFLLIYVIVTTILLRYLESIADNVKTMRNEYNDILRKEIDQVNSCFNDWKETIMTLDSSININSDLLDILREDLGKEETDVKANKSSPY